MRTFRTLIALMISITAISQLNAQNFLVQEWMHTTGIPDTIDWSASCTDGSGNIYVTTNTLVDGEKANILTTKYNSSGVVQWEVTYNSAGNDNDYGTAIYVDGSGNVYVAAASYISGHVYDYRTIKYNSSGTQQWNVTYNGPGSSYDVPTDILVDGSGNVYVTGASYGSTSLSDYCTIKYNSSGTSQWTSRYDYASDQDIAAILKFSPSGRVLVAGASANSPGSWDFAAIKYNQNTGAQLAVNRNSASGSGFDEIYGADVDGSGNIYLTGRAAVVDEGYNMRTVKLDTAVNVVWARNYNKADLDDESHGVIVDLSGNVYITGWITNEDETKSFETIKYNSSGTLQWHKEENAENAGLDSYALKISASAYGNIIVAGNVDNSRNLDFLSVIYNSDGDRLWVEQYDDGDNDNDKVNFVKADGTGSFYVGGKSYAVSTATNRLIKYNWINYTIPPDDDTEKPAAYTFFENKGQLVNTNDDPISDIKYYTKSHYPDLYFSDDSLSYVFSHIDTTSSDDTISRVTLSFYGSSSSKEIHAAESQGGEYLNYYLPQCPSGITNVHHFDRLYEKDVYTHVDLDYYFDNQGLKYYIIIHPGWNSGQANPVLEFKGADSVVILGDGRLKIKTKVGEIIQKVPETYQINADGTFSSLAWTATYHSAGTKKIDFTLGSYTNTKDLVIEIKLEGIEEGWDCQDNVIYGTYYGGNGYDRIDELKILKEDGTRYLYMAGVTRSDEFPGALLFIDDLTGTLYDYFFQKFYVPGYWAKWGTYIGGHGNDGPGGNGGIAIDDLNGNIIYAAQTESDDYPTMPYGTAYYDDSPNAAIYDGVIGMINSSGDHLWGTYLSGENGMTDLNAISKFKPWGEDEGFIVAGHTGGGTGFPYTANPTGDFPYATSGKGMCLVEFDANFQVKFATQFGTNDASAESINDIIEFNHSSLYLVGTIYGSGLSTVGAFQGSYGGGLSDAAVFQYSNLRDIELSSYFGGDGNENATAVAEGNDNNIYVVGDVADDYGETMPLTNAGGYYDDEFNGTGAYETDGFIVRLNGYNDLTFSTYFGGLHSDVISDIAQAGDYLLVSGSTSNESDMFPLQDFSGAYYDDVDNATQTPFIALIQNNSDLIWSTFLGDDAGGNSISLATDIDPADEVAVGYVGTIFNYNQTTFGYLPLCRPNDGAFFQDAPYGFYLESYKNTESAINAFDLSIFEDIFVDVDNMDEPVNNIYIYPNPTSDIVHIFADNYYEIAGLRIFNSTGQMVRSEQTSINSEGISINISDLPAGVYTVILYSAHGIYSSQIVKNSK